LTSKGSNRAEAEVGKFSWSARLGGLLRFAVGEINVLAEFSPVYRQDTAVRLVEEFMLREDLETEMRNRRTPVLLFTGPRGIGKSALLNQVRDALNGIPYAWVDCAGIENARDILLLLAFSLNRQSSRYGELTFPRFITGSIVMEAKLQLNTTDRAAARKQISDELAAVRRTPAMLDAAVGALAKVAIRLAVAGADWAGVAGTGWLGNDQAVGDFAGTYSAEFVRRVLGTSRSGRRLLLGTGQDWYGDQDRGLGLNSLDVLVDLRAKAGRAAEGKADGDDDSREVARLLWAAFLADLRHGFAVGRRAGDQTHNCVVLLDNADTAPGRAFLGELLVARGLRGEEEPDPLTVVAASRGDLTARVLASGVTALADASYADYLRRGDTDLARNWYPVTLPPLNWTESRDIVSALQLPGVDGPAVTTAVHAFTGGHRGATHTLLAAMSQRSKDAGSLLASLAGPDPGDLANDGRTAEEAMLEALLGSLPATAADDLVTCAAATDRDAVARMTVNSGLLRPVPGEKPAIDVPEFWSRGPVDGPMRLHPLLRRLLLRRLARRDEAAPAGWAAVHEWLRKDAAGDLDAELYHTLALADEKHPEYLMEVVRRLPTGPVTSAAGWLRRIAWISTAPNRLGHPFQPWELVTRLTEWAGGQRESAAVGRFVVSSWLGADPLCAPSWRWLLRQMASELELIAPTRVGDGLNVLRDEAQRYRDTAESSWHDVADFWAARTALATKTSKDAI
jgi:hypothetical protein